MLVYPNPFSEKLIIEFGLAEGSMVKVEIFNALGSKINQLFEGYLEGGAYSRFEFVPHGLANQLLIYQVTVQNRVYRGKVIYNK